MTSAARTGGAGGRRLWVNVAFGIAGGALYTLIDAYLDGRIGEGTASSPRAVAIFHGVLDLVLPIVTGALLGVAAHYLRLRAEVAAAERLRVEELRGHLHKIERDQAVWVIAASLLHELRNPLHALGLLLDEIAELPADAASDRAALIDRARAQSERILAHLGALKSLPSARRPELPGIDVSEVVSRFVHEIEKLLREESVKISVRGAPGITAQANATYVQVIIENLIENSLDALRERGGPGHIEVEVSCEDERAVIRVRDDGPGIPPDAAPSVFEPLRSTKARGLGLGLSIARALSRSMSGDLLLERVGPPATFRLELMLSSAP